MADPPRGNDPAARVVAATGRRLYVTSLTLVALLVVGIGVTAVIATRGALDAEVDRALRTAADSAIARQDGEVPAQESNDSEDVTPGSSDTFVLYLDAQGGLVSDPSRIRLPGLPFVGALPEASRTGVDLRTVDAGGVSVRLLTRPIGPLGHPLGFVQAGFVLTLNAAQSASLVLAIGLVGLLGLLGAALVTLVVTRRALDPIRRTFAAQLRFVADASHELRTPAALIRATAEVLERESLVAPGGVGLVEDIVAESDRLGRLVGDLLMLSTSGASDLVLDHDAVELGELVRGAVRRIEPLASERHVDVVVDSSGSTVVDGDRDRLVQLILILVDNAIDHAPAGTPVEVALTRHGSSAVLSVTDQGPGIPVNERERVFEPFARLDAAARPRRGGAGLGLAIARRIAAAHGGSIVATTGQHGGARFEMTLPMVHG
jgi:two-component system, OmpR family, sensor histidine kinase CiaH